MHGMPALFTKCDPVTPSDGTPQHFAAFIVLVAGNIVFRAKDSTADVTVTGALVGTVYPIETQFIKSTGTTATVGALA